MKKDVLFDMVSAWSGVTGKKLKLIFLDLPPQTAAFTDGVNIALQRKSVTKRIITDLEHELSHIVFRSSLALKKRFGDLLPEFEKIRGTIFNVVDDERSESNWCRLRIGSERFFQKEGEEDFGGKVTHGLRNSMIAGRYGLWNLVDPAFKGLIPTLKCAFEMVYRNSPVSSYRASGWLWERIKEFFNQDLPKDFGNGEQKPRKGVKGDKGQKSLDQFKKTDKKDSKTTGGDQGQKPDTPKEDGKDMTGAGKKKLKDEENRLQQIADRRDSKHEKSYWPIHDSTAKYILRTPEDDSDDPDLEELLEKGREEMKDLTEQIQQKLAESVPNEKVPRPEKLIKGGTVNVTDLSMQKRNVLEMEDQKRSEADKFLAKKLSMAFKNIKGKYTDTHDRVGDRIDVEEYIRWQASDKLKAPEFFLEDEEETGFDIIISIDCSGSMKSHMNLLRKTAATLMLAVEDIKDVDITTMGWYGPSNHIQINVAEKHEDISGIVSSGSTPTHLALQYAIEVARQKTADKKLVVFFTDGKPTMGTRDTWIINNTCRGIVKRGRQAGIQFFGIMLGFSPAAEKFMRAVFETQYMLLGSAKEAFKVLEHFIITRVAQAMRGG